MATATRTIIQPAVALYWNDSVMPTRTASSARITQASSFTETPGELCCTYNRNDKHCCDKYHIHNLHCTDDNHRSQHDHYPIIPANVDSGDSGGGLVEGYVEQLFVRHPDHERNNAEQAKQEDRVLVRGRRQVAEQILVDIDCKPTRVETYQDCCQREPSREHNRHQDIVVGVSYFRNEFDRRSSNHGDDNSRQIGRHTSSKNGIDE